MWQIPIICPYDISWYDTFCFCCWLWLWSQYFCFSQYMYWLLYEKHIFVMVAMELTFCRRLSWLLQQLMQRRAKAEMIYNFWEDLVWYWCWHGYMWCHSCFWYMQVWSKFRKWNLLQIQVVVVLMLW